MTSEHSLLLMPHAIFKAFFIHFLKRYVHDCLHRSVVREEELKNKRWLSCYQSLWRNNVSAMFTL